MNAPLFVFTAWFTSLVYVSIAYALSATFMHVGKALVVAMVMLQIPGATGLYPIEMTSPFFQAVYPALPFTYGINARCSPSPIRSTRSARRSAASTTAIGAR